MAHSPSHVSALPSSSAQPTSWLLKCRRHLTGLKLVALFWRRYIRRCRRAIHAMQNFTVSAATTIVTIVIANVSMYTVAVIRASAAHAEASPAADNKTWHANNITHTTDTLALDCTSSSNESHALLASIGCRVSQPSKCEQRMATLSDTMSSWLSWTATKCSISRCRVATHISATMSPKSSPPAP